jgi:hypothetical protein
MSDTMQNVANKMTTVIIDKIDVGNGLETVLVIMKLEHDEYLVSTNVSNYVISSSSAVGYTIQ